jgi:hypothetical protein
MKSKEKTKLQSWYATFTDAGDGSGDLFLKFPDDLCERMVRKAGDVFEYHVSGRRLARRGLMQNVTLNAETFEIVDESAVSNRYVASDST